jgi:LPS-assembly protein
VDLYPYLAYPIERAGWFVRPEVGYRYTGYKLDRDEEDTPHRGVPIYSLDAGMVFERGFSLGNHAWTQTLEPRLYYLRVPYRNQDDIPVFDTQLVPFTFGQMFRTNGFVGADRQADANNLTLALTTRVLDDGSGDERLSASIGQIRYFDEQRVQLPGVKPTDWNGSAYVGNLTLSLTPRWRLTVDQQWNPNSDRTDLSAVGVQHRFGAEGVLNLSYRFRRGFIEQADASALIPIGNQWRIVARNNYSLNESKTLERFVGLERDSCCTAWRVVAREWVRNVEGELDKALFFEIEFKGVGAFGQRSEDFLTRAVRGYRSRW